MRERVRQRFTARRNGDSASLESATLLEATVADFLAALHPTDSGGFIDLRALPSRRQAFVQPGDAVGIERFIRTHSGQNLYFGVATRKSRDSGQAENCSALRALFVDLDFKSTAEHEARAKLERFPLKPTVVIHSGGGLHVYWLTREPLDLQIEAAKTKSLLRRLALVLGGDLASAEPARILRLPGSFNHKYDPPQRVLIEQFEPERAYNPCDFDDLPSPEPEPQNGNGRGFTVGERIREGERNDTLYRLARSLKARGLSEAAILAALQTENGQKCDPPLSDAEVERIAANAFGQADRPDFERNGNGSSEEQRRKAASISAHLTDTGNAKRFAEQHGQHARYCHPWRKWLLYEEGCWRSDDHGGAVTLAKQTVAHIYEEAALAGDEDTRKAIAKHAARSENEARTRAMLSLAQSEPGIPVTPDELDADGWLLNVANGTIDLRTGCLREHRPTDLLTKFGPVVFDPRAICPTFEAFLRRTFADDPDLIHFVQKFAGYSLTAETREQCFALCHGVGANGKSTLLRTLTELLGDYATWTPAETFLLKRGGGVPNDVAALRNTRLVAAAEPEAEKRLAAALMKAVTGQDRIAARFLYGEFFTFLPQFKIWLATNHKPEVKETTHALWRRVMLIPFEVVIPSHQQDRSLPDKLRAEYPGILRWAVEGCLAWQREGLEQPRAVRQATAAYRKEQDSFALFLEACCVMDDTAEELAGRLYREYRQWTERVGERPETQTAFGTRLSERGFPAVGRGGRRYRQGLRLKRLADGENE